MTSAQFLFSLVLVIFILITLAVPGNPLNQIVRLAVDTASWDHGVVIGLSSLAASMLAYGTTLYSGESRQEKGERSIYGISEESPFRVREITRCMTGMNTKIRNA